MKILRMEEVKNAAGTGIVLRRWHIADKGQPAYVAVTYPDSRHMYAYRYTAPSRKVNFGAARVAYLWSLIDAYRPE